MTENFIFTDFIEDLTLCDDIIQWFDNTDDQKEPGTTGAGVNENLKKSTDLCLNFNGELNFRYRFQLNTVVLKYIQKFKFCNSGCSPWELIEGTNVQHYKPSEGYYAWHTERLRASIPNGSRHLVYMTYLNDVTDDGETEFYYQELKIQPKKGLTVIWPADWTHTHRGIASMTQNKYIVTGWYNFIM